MNLASVVAYFRYGDVGDLRLVSHTVRNHIMLHMMIFIVDVLLFVLSGLMDGIAGRIIFMVTIVAGVILAILMGALCIIQSIADKLIYIAIEEESVDGRIQQSFRR